MNAAPWRDRPGIGGLGLLWRVPLLPLLLVVVLALMIFWKTLEWYYG